MATPPQEPGSAGAEAKRVLLVVPPEPELRDLKQSGSTWPRIGLAYVAAYLRDQGVNVRILDCIALGLGHEGVAEAVREFRPQFVGAGPFTEEIYEARGVCRTAKEIDPAIVTVFGGPHASALPERTLREFPDVDVAVCGEGEVSFSKLIQGADPEAIRGIAWRDGDGRVVVNEPAELVENVDSLPFPAWDLFPLDRYRGILTLHLRQKVHRPTLELPILSARGCPFRCTFCYKTYPGLRNRDPVRIVDELQHGMETYGATEFFFVEGTFAANRKQGLRICEEIIDRGLADKIRWIVDTRVNVVSEELLRKMKAAGCVRVEYGVESGDEQILRNSKKGITIPQVKAAVRMARRAGLKVGCYFIIGHPFETRQGIQKTYRLARQLNPDLMNVGIMIPYPGTVVRRMAERGEGNYRLVCDDWSEYTKQRGGPLELTTIPLRELQRIQSREYIKYYLRPSKLWFILKNLPIRKTWQIVKSLLQAGV